MGNQEEVKFAVNDFGLLDEALVDVGTLGRVLDEVLTIVAHRLLEESLAHSFVHNNESNLRRFLLLNLAAFHFYETVFDRDDVVQLLQLLVNDLLSH